MKNPPLPPDFVLSLSHAKYLLKGTARRRRLRVVEGVAHALGRHVAQLKIEAVAPLRAVLRGAGKKYQTDAAVAFHEGRSFNAKPFDLPAFLAWPGPPDTRRAGTRRVVPSPAVPSASALANTKRLALLPDATETQIHIAVVDELKARSARDVFWFHCPNGEYRHPSVGAKLKAMGTIPGVPDLMFVVGGLTYGLELKVSRGGVVSPAQAVVHSRIADAGGVTAVARGYTQSIEILTRWGVFADAKK